MKRITLLALMILLLAATGAFAQQLENESELYPKTMQIHKIYNHSNGFKIEYVKSDYSLGSFWAPIEWFRGTNSTGGIAYGEGGAYPYVSFFYKAGEMSHFRLYLVENPAHESWGSLDPGTDFSGEFPDPESKPDITY